MEGKEHIYAHESLLYFSSVMNDNIVTYGKGYFWKIISNAKMTISFY